MLRPSRSSFQTTSTSARFQLLQVTWHRMDLPGAGLLMNHRIDGPHQAHQGIAQDHRRIDSHEFAPRQGDCGQDLGAQNRRWIYAIDAYTPPAYNAHVIFLGTPVFTRQIRELVNDDQYREPQTALLTRPDAGDIIPRSGGLRKIRIGASGRGMRGGGRVIYYWVVAKDQIYMLLAYAKNLQDDLTEEQLKTLRALIRQEFG
jgi:hypothetical protein